MKTRLYFIGISAIVVIGGLITIFGAYLRGVLFPGEDSWAHYRDGGVFVTNSGAMSEDGSSIVYSSPRSGHGDIYSCTGDGAKHNRLTFSEAYESSPVFIPKSKKIAYVREENGQRHIWTMNEDGTSQRPLTFGNTLDDVEEVSRDGTQLLISRSSSVLAGGKTPALFLLNITRLDEPPVLLGKSATLMSDQKAVAFSSTENPDTVKLRRSDVSSDYSLTRGRVTGSSPDGGYVCVLREKTPGKWERDSEIWLVDAHTGAETQISTGHSPCFIDERTVVYYSGFECFVWLYDIAGRRTERLDAPEGFKVRPTPCGGKNGCLIRVVTSDRVGDVYFLDLNGKCLSRLFSLK